MGLSYKSRRFRETIVSTALGSIRTQGPCQSLNSKQGFCQAGNMMQNWETRKDRARLNTQAAELGGREARLPQQILTPLWAQLTNHRSCVLNLLMKSMLSAELPETPFPTPLVCLEICGSPFYKNWLDTFCSAEQAQRWIRSVLSWRWQMKHERESKISEFSEECHHSLLCLESTPMPGSTLHPEI